MGYYLPKYISQGHTGWNWRHLAFRVSLLVKAAAVWLGAVRSVACLSERQCCRTSGVVMPCPSCIPMITLPSCNFHSLINQHNACTRLLTYLMNHHINSVQGISCQGSSTDPLAVHRTVHRCRQKSDQIRPRTVGGSTQTEQEPNPKRRPLWRSTKECFCTWIVLISKKELSWSDQLLGRDVLSPNTEDSFIMKSILKIIVYVL